MKNKFLTMALCIIGVSTLFLTACSDTKDEALETEPKVLNLLETSNIPSLVPWKATDSVSFLTLGNVMEGLTTLGENGTVHPGIAESWDVSEDGLVYTFHLRKDAKWVTSTGEEYGNVTAKDFIYSWNKLIDPDSGAQYNFMLGSAGIKGGEELKDLGVVAVDDYTLEVTLARPTTYFLSLMSFPSFYPVNEEFVKEVTEDKFGTTVDTFLYNGAYVFSEWKISERHRWDKNAKYWDSKNVAIDTIDFRVVEGIDNNTAVGLYLEGKIDSVGLSGENVGKYGSRPDVITRQDPTLFYLEVNNGKGDMTPTKQLLANSKARQAIDLVVNKSFITDDVFKNGSTPAYSLIPKGFAYSPTGQDFADVRIAGHTGRDIELAKQLWTEARTETGITEKLDMEILIFTGDEAAKVGAAIKDDIQANLEGVEVTIAPLPFAEKLDRSHSGDYDLAWSGWGPDYADPMTFLDMWVTDGGQNSVGYSNPEFDKIIDDAKYGELAKDANARWEALIKAEDIIINQDQAIVPLYQRAAIGLRNQKVINLYAQQIGPGYIYKWADIEN